MSIDESKRLRRNYLSFTDFPDTILKSVTDYLYPVSQALFAVALSAPTQSASWWTSNIQQHISLSSKAIISNGQWDVLDFGTVEKTLTSKLNDDDIRAVLVCTDSRNKLKRLYLINCNPTTYGLQPLEGSVVLEQLDLDKNQESMSIEVIVPILLSIINKFDNRLKHLTLPNAWHTGRTIGDDPNTWEDNWSNQTLERFMRRYHGLLDYRPFNCADCNGDRDCSESSRFHNLEGQYHISDIQPQSFTCYKCLRNICNKSEYKVMHCSGCERGYCGICAPRNYDCVTCHEELYGGGQLQGENFTCRFCKGGNGETEECGECGAIHCVIHETILSCDKCDLTRCVECAGGHKFVCKHCSKSNCFECADMVCCVYCGKDMCFQCIKERGEDADNDCAHCQEAALRHLRTIRVQAMID